MKIEEGMIGNRLRGIGAKIRHKASAIRHAPHAKVGNAGEQRTGDFLSRKNPMGGALQQRATSSGKNGKTINTLVDPQSKKTRTTVWKNDADGYPVKQIKEGKTPIPMSDKNSDWLTPGNIRDLIDYHQNLADFHEKMSQSSKDKTEKINHNIKSMKHNEICDHLDSIHTLLSKNGILKESSQKNPLAGFAYQEGYHETLSIHHKNLVKSESDPEKKKIHSAIAKTHDQIADHLNMLQTLHKKI